MKGRNAIRVVAVVSAGMMAGLLFGDWLGPAFARSAMSVSSIVEFQQIIHTNYLLTLPACCASGQRTRDLESLGNSPCCTDCFLGVGVHPRNSCSDSFGYRKSDMSYFAGFFGPIIFTPDANQGPLLGILITGPLGFIAGAIGGTVYSHIRARRAVGSAEARAE
jgi:hypothetical protein